MTDTNTANWDNYWQGRASQLSGNALVEVGIEKNHALKDFWLTAFRNIEKSAHIVDFACGAGSVLEHAHKVGLSNLTGLDVSQKALDVMVEKIPSASSVRTQVDKTPLKNNSVDIITSQFGVEYAGSRKKLHEAFLEMHRILKPNGRIIVLAHAENSVIYEGCKRSLDQINNVEKSQFIKTAKKLILALSGSQTQGKSTDFKNLTRRLNQSAEPIVEWLRTSDRSHNEFARFTYYLLESSHKLIVNHERYPREESLGWFKGMEAELKAYKGRMLSMTQAALNKVEIMELVETLAKGQVGLDFTPNQSFNLSTDTKQAAWIIKAKKR